MEETLSLRSVEDAEVPAIVEKAAGGKNIQEVGINRHSHRLGREIEILPFLHQTDTALPKKSKNCNKE